MDQSVTYAIGDIHGCFEKLVALLNNCDAHCGNSQPRFVFLGDYVDRGPDSKKVVDFLMRGNNQFPERFVCLKGNHEQLMVAAAAPDVPDDFHDHWMQQNGGAATLASYGVDKARSVPAATIEWLRSLPLKFSAGKRLFVHAGIMPGVPIDHQKEKNLLWIRQPFLSSEADHGLFVVHGHTPTADSKPDLRANRLNIDTGASRGGPLTAAAFIENAILPTAFVFDDGRVETIGSRAVSQN